MVSRRLPVMGSTRRQYLVLGEPAGAVVGVGSVFATARIGNVAAIMLKAMTNPVCAMAVLPDGNAVSAQLASLMVVSFSCDGVSTKPLNVAVRLTELPL